jgi:hypothetical protein
MATTIRLNTMADYEALRKRDTRKVEPGAPARICGLVPAEVKKNPRGRHESGKMNKSETAFSIYLEIQRAAGEVRGWKFEAVKLKLADNTYFIPDFNVEMANGDLVMVEVKRLWKGRTSPHWEDDARVKIKVAAELWRGWFSFYGVHWDGGQWVYEGF